MGQLALVTTPVEAVAEAVRRVSGGQGTEGDLALLRALRFVGGDDELSDWGKAFDDNWWVYSDKDEATTIYKAGVLLLPETEGLMQVLHGRGALPVAGVAYYLARHGLTDTEDEKAVRRFLQMVNGLGIVAYSNQKQTVRLVEPLPDESGDEAPAVRVIEPDRPYTNVVNLREVLRSCRDRIWWTEPHFVPKLLEFLNYEGDPDRISEIHILTGLPGEDQEDFLNRGKADFKRFRKEMAEKGITAEWRVYQDRPAQHDRYLLERSKVWNMPPLNTLLRGDYSEIIETQNRPPFEGWWDEAKPL